MSRADYLSPLEKTLNRNSLKYSVGRAIFCPGCRDIMDVRRAVEVTASQNGNIVMVKALCITCWDKQRAEFERKLAELKATIEVLDGRVLFPSKATKRRIKSTAVPTHAAGSAGGSNSADPQHPVDSRQLPLFEKE